MRERGADAHRVPAAVEAVLEALDEVGVAVGVQVEEVGGGLPPGRHGYVVAVLPRPLDRDDVQVVEPAKAPVRLLLPARHGQRHVEAVAGGELARVLHDHAHATGELEVLQEKCDLQERAIVLAPCTRPPSPNASRPVARARAGPYAAPPAGAPARIAFVGQETYFRASALTSGTPQVLPRFIDFRAGSDPQQDAGGGRVLCAGRRDRLQAGGRSRAAVRRAARADARLSHRAAAARRRANRIPISRCASPRPG